MTAPTPGAGGGTAWAGTAGTLWPGDPRPDGGVPTPALHGPGADGAPAAERYVLVRLGGQVRFAVSAGLGPRARSRVLRYGNGLRTRRRRVVRSGLAALFLLGLPRGRATLAAVDDSRDRLGLRSRVAAALDRDPADLHLAVAVLDRDGGPRPTVLVTDGHGAPCAFLKVGWGEHRRTTLQREHTATTRAAAVAVPAVLVPRPLMWATPGSSSVLATAPLPDDVRPVATDDPEATFRGLDALVDAHPTSTHPLATSPWFARLRRDAAAVAEGAGPAAVLGQRCVTLLERVARDDDGVGLPHGLRHGDWSAWNLGWSQGRLVIWDWEYGEECAPRELDRQNWHYAWATSVTGSGAGEAGRALLARAARSDEEGSARRYLLDMTVRRTVLAAAGEHDSARAAGELLELLADSRAE